MKGIVMEIEWKKYIAEIDPMNGDCTLINDDVLIWAENRLNELQALVEMSSAHVFASARAGIHHDRDINAAQNMLLLGTERASNLGLRHVA